MFSDDGLEVILGKKGHKLTKKCVRVVHTKKPRGEMKSAKGSTPVVWLTPRAFSIGRGN